ncbi:MAG: hypothetical protein PHS92_04600 [Candidatus Gracilibacteria bacterium]|nr:hypothetical protein [Candidatus Gracilibacteria bacterium]
MFYIKNGYLTLNGILLNNGTQNIIIIGPSGNGKSTYVKEELSDNSIRILDDDIVVFDPKNLIALHGNQKISVNKIIFYYNSIKDDIDLNFSNKDIFSISLAVPILGNELSRNIIAVEKLQEKIDVLYQEFLKLKIIYFNIINYNYEEISRNIGLE